MYLTRFRINTARMGARRLLSSPQVMHAAVMSSFPTAPPAAGEGPRVLWRVDHNSASQVLLYIVSPDRPDLTHLVEQAGWPTAEEGWRTRPYTPFLSRLENDGIWAFRLTANPVHSIRRTDGEPTKRTAHLTPRHQTQWLLKRQKDAGFRILEKPEEQRRLPEGDAHELIVHGRRDLAFGKTEQTSGRKNRVTLTAVTFDGRLQVTDPDALRRTLVVGLGKAKAYGCGLMTLAPVG
ncbi:type I-E CRISPR-associated protein Cas6/Cse3/CasE [Streptomyces verrucosisporus]|uniref:type I-E CRISPR-associated protein Cas6/Cse3/CasE n=1 Tax=Streptomyces verrucosisporus TaxID=1695161 RepID=UPI0019D16397|nr:type I-E CRISPR-associated protein Cas6/Cse3/CasE [Streptomyces verrucosisporus]MBN3933036.1 type I-E CRISPR-associated protein Cas6/Cse3/CasE [Streptomyces verrucosisporus]